MTDKPKYTYNPKGSYGKGTILELEGKPRKDATATREKAVDAAAPCESGTSSRELSDDKRHSNTKPVLPSEQLYDEPDAFEQYLFDYFDGDTHFLAKYRKQKVENEKAIIDNYNKRLLSDAAVEAATKRMDESMEDERANEFAMKEAIQAAIKSADNERKGDKKC